MSMDVRGRLGITMLEMALVVVNEWMVEEEKKELGGDIAEVRTCKGTVGYPRRDGVSR